MQDSSQFENPMATDGFEFIEFAPQDPEKMCAQYEAMGFRCVAKHHEQNVLHYQQGDIHFIVNCEMGSMAQNFAKIHGCFRLGDGFSR